MKYWNKEGLFQNTFNACWETLVPRDGASKSLAGELIRAAGRINYDAFNNGFCNNTSGPWNFLSTYMPKNNEIHEHLKTIENCVNTNGYTRLIEGSKRDSAIDSIIDCVVQYIVDHPASIKVPAVCDCFDMSDDDCEDYDDDE